jgi:hypothetical protein
MSRSIHSGSEGNFSVRSEHPVLSRIKVERHQSIMWTPVFE